jgi:hypothetical protein
MILSQSKQYYKDLIEKIDSLDVEITRWEANFLDSILKKME